MSGPVIGEDGVARCPWGSAPGVMRDYHDTEWGSRVPGESAYLERLTLEAFQSGLSWSTILNKREAFREVFAGFDADTVAAYDEADVARLMADAGIVRNRAQDRGGGHQRRARPSRCARPAGWRSSCWASRPRRRPPRRPPPRSRPRRRSRWRCRRP